jgi:hypothetical protein
MFETRNNGHMEVDFKLMKAMFFLETILFTQEFFSYFHEGSSVEMS